MYNCTQVNSCTPECDPVASNCHPWIRHSECIQNCEVDAGSVCDLLLLLSSIPKLHISVYRIRYITICIQQTSKQGPSVIMTQYKNLKFSIIIFTRDTAQGPKKITFPVV